MNEKEPDERQWLKNRKSRGCVKGERGNRGEAVEKEREGWNRGEPEENEREREREIKQRLRSRRKRT